MCVTSTGSWSILQPLRIERAGQGTYDWAWVRIVPPADEATGQHWLLVRRRIRDGEFAFYRCWSPKPVTLATLARVPGTRWCVEECFRAGKDEAGLDQNQVRKWTSWYRYTTLAMLAQRHPRCHRRARGHCRCQDVGTT